jgi:NADH dehydrogenase
MQALKKIVIIGGGFAGLSLAQSLKKSAVEVILLDKSNHHLFQPLLYQVATAALSPGDIAVPLRGILRNQRNVQVFLEEVQKIELAEKKIFLSHGDTLSYDYLIVAVGARHTYFGKDEWERYAAGLKTIREALQIRERLLLSFEKAERLNDPKKQAPYLCFVVIGAGPTGVELAGAIAEIARKTMIQDFRQIDPSQARVLLVDASPRVLPSYPEDLSEKAAQALKDLGVELYLNRRVNQVTATGVQVGEDWIETPNLIWAAGNRASPLLKTLGTPLDTMGRAIVTADLSLPEYPHTFVIGDAAHCKTAQGQALPGIAPVAVQQGRFLGTLLKKELENPQHPRPSFVYRDKGMMATIGKAKAVAVLGSFRFSGFLAWVLWCGVHIFFLIGFRNKFLVMLEWMGHYFSSQRGVRLITQTSTESKKEPEV